MLAFRPATSADDDRQFIVSTWSRTFKDSHYAGILDTDDYAAVMHATIKRVLDRPETVAMLACEHDDPGYLYGHIVGEVEADAVPIVHYLFVKAPHRGRGIARGLVDALGLNARGYFVYTCKTGDVACLKGQCQCDPEDHPRRDLMPRGRFDPNGIRYSKANRRRRL